MLAEWDKHPFCPCGSAVLDAPQDDVTCKAFPCLPWFICRGSCLGLEAIILFIHDSTEKSSGSLAKVKIHMSLCLALASPTCLCQHNLSSLPSCLFLILQFNFRLCSSGPYGTTHAPFSTSLSPPPGICIVMMVCALLHADCLLCSTLVSFCLKLSLRTSFECSFIQHPNLPLSLKLLLSHITANTHPSLRHRTPPDQKSTTTWVMASILPHLLKDNPFPYLTTQELCNS